MSVAAERSRSRVVDRGCERGTSRSGTTSARRPMCGDRADAAGRRSDERRSRCHDLHHRVRQPIDVPRIVVHRRSDGDVGRGKKWRYDLVRNDSEKLHAVADAGRPAPWREAMRRDRHSPAMATRNCGMSRLQRDSGIDQVFESLFLDEAADCDNERYIICDASAVLALAPVRPHSA